jgi:hypothetical protein
MSKIIEMKKKIIEFKPIINVVVKILLLVVCIYYINHNLEYKFTALLNSFRNFQPYCFILSIFFIATSFFISIYKFNLLINFWGINSKPRDVLRISWKASFVSNFMFGSFVADANRIHDTKNVYKISYKKSAFLLIGDRLLTLIIYLSTAGLFFCVKFFSNRFGLESIFLGTSTLSILLAITLIINYLYIHLKIKISAQNIKKFYLYITLGFLSTVLIGCGFILLANSLGIHLKLFELDTVLIGLIGNYLPLSFSGWGTRELTLVFFVGKTHEHSMVINSSIIFGLINTLIAFPGAFYYFKSK